MHRDLSLVVEPFAMLLALFTISHLIILTTANPFHKYPFVFLLDVGNEELKKTNSEQIRVSIPGGTLAIRYPATGDGDTIAHVRVSGIDFGTDLKANILDGGPGYKYVVLIFMGNPGVPYDAVVTVQTIPDDKIDDYNQYSNLESNNLNQDEENANNSAEDTSDDLDVQINEKSNAETVQASSNVYNYAQYEVVEPAEYKTDGVQYPDDEDVQQSNDKDIHDVYKENLEQGDVRNEENNDYVAGDAQIEENSDYNAVGEDDQNQYNENLKPDQYSVNDEISDNDDSNRADEVRIVENNPNNRFQFTRPSNEVNPEEGIEEDENVESGYEEDPGDSDQMFNDEEVHNNADKYRDSNNNFDADDSSAVAY